MNFANVVLPWLAGFAGWIVVVVYASAQARGRAQALIRIVGIAVGAFLAVLLAGKVGLVLPQMGSDSAHARACDVLKIFIALSAAGWVFFEAARAGQQRPIAARYRKLVLISLGIASIVVYFQSFRFGYPRFYHRWDQYHYYMGAKYFPEIGYDGLYKCTAIAQAEIGKVTASVDGRTRAFDVTAEVKKPEKKIRNLSGDNLLIKADEVISQPEQCHSRFSPERWEQYKQDVTFFSTQCYLDNYWTQMQQDHGYNPPPVWTLAGHYLANLHPPGQITTIGGTEVLYAQVLALIDVAYLLGMFGMIWWAFGWRIFAVAAILWGCQSAAPAYWTLGAMLRQDWLFFFVGAVCLARKRYFGLAGAAMVYGALIRIFPGLAVVGWLILAGQHIVRHKRMKPSHLRALIGGTLAAGVLLGASMSVVGKDSYERFVHHTIRVHDQTPLTNHMGLRVLIGHDVGVGPESGRMRYTKDGKLTDPFEVWKRMRVERYERYKPVAYGLLGTTFFVALVVLRRVRSLWLAQCLSQVWLILGSQLTCYYYSFMIIMAPITRLRREVEVWLFGFAALSQFVWRIFGYNDDKYAVLTLLSLILSYATMLLFAKRADQIKPGGPLWDLPAGKLGGLLCLVPGVILAAMGAMYGDVSSVGLGAALVAAGIGLFSWSRDQAKAAKA